MSDEPRPSKGDLVLYLRKTGGEHRTKLRTRTGRVLSRHTWGVRVDSSTKRRNHRVPWEHVKGWWPKGTPDRSFDNLREPEVTA